LVFISLGRNGKPVTDFILSVDSIKWLGCNQYYLKQKKEGVACALFFW
jgi:hypothetical protein